MPRPVPSTGPVLLLLLLACSSCSPASASRHLFNTQARVPDSTTVVTKPDPNSLLYECFCISTYPYVKHEKRFVQAADAADVRAGKVPTCPAGGWQPGSAAYGSTGCRLVKGQLD
uniref:Secreted protein n=2 Tax=Tetradesmus obliquus TaxID=3088 RepID=A0A383W309_TETOB|eukprot:jgi/Sobl393_1/8427/SZX78166.1